MTFRRLASVGALGVLVAAAAYMLVYLYRWEWQRAVIAGTFLLVVEVGIGIVLVLDRVARVEARLNAQHQQRAGLDETRTALRNAEAPARQPFAWLSDSTDRMSVFVPLLLGAGVVLSVLAWIVERVARLTARPTLERGLALRLQPLTATAGVLSGGDRSPLPPLPLGSSRTVGFRLAVAAAVVVAIGAVGTGIDRLGDVSQNRPDALVQGSAGRVVLQLDNKQAPDAYETTARNLWGACHNQIGTAYRLTGVEQLDGGRVELRVRPAIGRYAERRLRGCLDDAVIDLVQASVLDVSAR